MHVDGPERDQQENEEHDEPGYRHGGGPKTTELDLTPILGSCLVFLTILRKPGQNEKKSVAKPGILIALAPAPTSHGKMRGLGRSAVGS
jgi:hypothetical protein